MASLQKKAFAYEYYTDSIFVICCFTVSSVHQARRLTSRYTCQSTLGEAVIFKSYSPNKWRFQFSKLYKRHSLFEKTGKPMCYIHHKIRMRHFGPYGRTVRTMWLAVQHSGPKCLLDNTLVLMPKCGDTSDICPIWHVKVSQCRSVSGLKCPITLLPLQPGMANYPNGPHWTQCDLMWTAVKNRRRHKKQSKAEKRTHVYSLSRTPKTTITSNRKRT